MKIPGLGNMQDIMKQAQEMQRKIAVVQNELAQKMITAESGGGMVKVTVNGKQQVMKIEIERDAIDPNDKEMLEDLVVAGINKAIEQSQKMSQDEMKKATSGMLPNIPGLNLPGL